MITTALLKKLKNYTRITTAFGPEDMALDTMDADGPRLIFSCTKHKGQKKLAGDLQFYYVKRDEQKATPFELEGYSKADLRPHGIALHQEGDEQFLYVISHEQKNKVHKILKFRVAHRKLVKMPFAHETHPVISNPNDLFVAANGTIYFSNPLGFVGATLGKRNSHVGRIKPGHEPEVLIDKMNYPNGVYLLGEYLYVTESIKNRFLRFTMQADGTVASKVKDLGKIKGGDNIMRTGSGFYIAGHPSKMGFLVHGLMNWNAPSSVHVFDLEKQKLKQILRVKGKIISASSTALLHDDYLYIAQVKRNFVLRIDLRPLKDQLDLPPTD